MTERTESLPKRQRKLEITESDSDNETKRRRLTPVEKENQIPVSPRPKSPSTSPPRMRQAEQERKPDTPAFPSIRSRLQMLSQKLTGSEQNTPPPPAAVLGTPRSLNKFVRDAERKLQTSEKPSTSQAALMRQQREEEMRILNNIQPVAASAWPKGSSSDPGPSKADARPPPRRSRVIWPPSQHQDDKPGVDLSFASSDGNLSLAPIDLSQMEVPAFGEMCPNAKPAVVTSSTPREMNTSALLDEIFKDVLEAAQLEEMEEEMEEGEMEKEVEEEEEEKEVRKDCASPTDRMEIKKERKAEEDNHKQEEGEGKQEEEKVEVKDEEGGDPESPTDETDDELLKLPPSCILSPLSESVDKVVTPLRLAAAASVSDRLSFQLTSEGLKTPTDTQPLYSIDAYRYLSRSEQKPMKSVTPWRRAPEKIRPQTQPSFTTKEKIKAYKEEAAKLQTVISQTLQALNCCVDEQHGKGSVQEAEAERLLLISSEKREALLAEIGRLEGDPEGSEEDPSAPLQPCRGSVCISEVHLPLKVDFVCSARNASRPTHFFFMLFRYGPTNVMATRLATAADADADGDTISFSTLITLHNIRSTFEIDVEVYSMSDTPNSFCEDSLQVYRRHTKQRVTPRKLLSTLKRTHQQAVAAVMPNNLCASRPSKFSLVGCHKITLASLGQSKFPLDKMKLEGKIRKLLGDEFQDKVPFLSPLEGHIRLQIQSEFHSEVEHHGFLTMFKDIRGLGSWHRLFFELKDTCLFYWNHPNERDNKPAEGIISLSDFKSQSVRPVKMDSCARPFTFELVSRAQQEEDTSSLNKRWFAADTQEERTVWMERLNQALLDLHTWTPAAPIQDQGPAPVSSDRIRESTL
ncbi:anillin isoform X1 [Alosa sapidissima]|uniref:anillin isoform X1 n=1 Tax=Alosa sapidissima TaxID=34773 RepID=UPI001C08F53A|nr:anillin isoform X1 [Alosa sapidissima]XP_041966162.1 anillin isoform X1 [Alosa sapidissima]XP_041966163.1 anillin isoform X1 [Alosa sapidissima]XP_041966164.1 anillin isoform X1 [Alosa sapidissima]